MRLREATSSSYIVCLCSNVPQQLTYLLASSTSPPLLLCSVPLQTCGSFVHTYTHTHTHTHTPHTRTHTHAHTQVLGKLYSILSDKEKRAAYDEDGTVDEEDSSIFNQVCVECERECQCSHRAYTKISVSFEVLNVFPLNQQCAVWVSASKPTVCRLGLPRN